MKLSILSLVAMSAMASTISAFSATAKTNFVGYWGQNSVSNSGGSEQNLAAYCGDGTFDVLVLAFVYQISNGVPILNLANHCGGQSCPQVGADIKTCQAAGKKVVISIGGASGQYALDTPAQGSAFATQIWNTFLGGNGGNRPFGDAVLDGVDLDLESGTNVGYAQFVTSLRGMFNGKQYIIGAAPQCPFPDVATSAALNAAWFDMVWVQFYNNACGVDTFGTSNFNFATWDNWARTAAVNPNTRILLGVPGGPGGAGRGVIDGNQLTNILNSIKSYPSFGGVMMWDAGIATMSGMAKTASNYLHGSNGGGGGNPPPAQTTVPPPAQTTTPPPPSTGPGCSGVPTWSSSAVYTAGNPVQYQGQKYVAKWWTQNETPGTTGQWGVWTSAGAC